MTTTTANSATQLSEVLPDLTINDSFDDKFVNQVLTSLTDAGKNLKQTGKDWRWVFAGKMTRKQATDKLTCLGEGWSLPTPTDTTVGALNGIKFNGANLVDNCAHGDSLPHVSFRNRGAITELFGFGMTIDVTEDTENLVYFVKK